MTMLYVELQEKVRHADKCMRSTYVNVAFPLVASVPLCAVTKYCELLSVWLAVKYCNGVSTPM